jgi:predicted metal-dependent hydrolase
MRVDGCAWARLEESVPRDVLRAEIEAWAKRIGVSPRAVHVRPMTRKWGSCSTKGRVSFNNELLHCPAGFRRRVIVEELLHLKVPNHGKLFRSLLRAYVGSDGLRAEPAIRGAESG